MSESPHLDPVALQRLQKLGGDAFAVKMIDLFVEYAGGKVAAARQAQMAGDMTALHDAVHPIKSSAGNIGARRVQELAVRIEQLARQAQREQLPGLVGELEAAYAGAKIALEEARRSCTGSLPGGEGTAKS